MTKLRLLLAIVFTLSFLSCDKNNNSQPDPNPDPDPGPQIPVESVEEVAEMNQALGWKLFKQEQLANPDENILISPLSIQTALNMALNGAKGNTLNEMLGLMECPGCIVGDINSTQKDLSTLLTAQSGHPTVTIANNYFYDKNRISVKPDFLSALANNYESPSEQLNFNNTQAALKTINDWVKTNTNGKIDKILDKITADDVAFLINALHFKADWATGFSPQLTASGEFTKADGSKVIVDYVNADRIYTYAKTADLDIVDLPFKDSTYSLSLIKPTASNTDPDWSLNITANQWLDLYKGMYYSRAIVTFPKLKLDYKNDLVKSLQNLGVVDAFSEVAADFTNMGTGAGNIFINQIKHKAVLEVDEKGAEGAAVTSVGFVLTSLPPVFYFNKPFVIVLRHIPTNTMLFTGLVRNPEF